MGRRRVASFVALVLLAACGGRGEPQLTPGANGVLSAATLDSLWAANAELLRQEEWSKAATMLERLQLEFPSNDPRRAEMRLRLGDARLGDKSYLQAVREYRRLSDEFPTDTLAPYGLLRAGEAYARMWRRPELDPTYGAQALATWQELTTRFPASGAAKLAATRITEVEEKFAFKEFKAATFYLKYKAYDSAILYLKDLVANYPRSAIVPRALTELIGAYKTLGYEEDTRDTCVYFRRNHPDAPNLDAVCPQVAATPGGTPSR